MDGERDDKLLLAEKAEIERQSTLSISERPVLEMVQQLRLFDACKAKGKFIIGNRMLFFDGTWDVAHVSVSIAFESYYRGDDLEKAIDVLMEGQK